MAHVIDRGNVDHCPLEPRRRYPEDMKRFGRVALGLAVICAALAQGDPPLHNVPERLAKWKPVEMPFNLQGLSTRERQMVEKLVEACRLLDDVYWRQSDLQ